MAAYSIFFLLACVLPSAVCTNTAEATTRHDLVTGGGGGSLCLQRVSTQAYDGVVAFKDGSRRLLFWNEDGRIWLAELDVDPTAAAAAVLRVGAKALIDLGSQEDDSAAARGRGGRRRVLAGVAVDSSTRVYVSYYTTTAAGPDGGAASSLVVDELSSPSGWRHEAQATLSRRVFSMASPEPSSSSPAFRLDDSYSGDILSRPTSSDPFIYVITDPAQTETGDSQLQQQAQILRFSVGQENMSGNGTITPQAYASGLGIPRRCAFDSDRPQDLYCAVLKGDQEIVYLISDPGAPSSSATPPSPTVVVAQQRSTTPSLVGGLLYRGYADNTLTGRYIYMDKSKLWVTVTSPDRNYSAAPDIRLTSCSAASPSPCGGDFTVTSFGQDADNNALLLTTDGAYLVVAPTLCDTDTNNPKLGKNNKNLLKGFLIAIAALVGTVAMGSVAYKIVLNCYPKSNPKSKTNLEMGDVTSNNRIKVENNNNNYYYWVDKQ